MASANLAENNTPITAPSFVPNNTDHDNGKLFYQTRLIDNISISVSEIQANEMENVFKKYLKQKYEGKCTENGLVKTDSVKIFTYSTGVHEGAKFMFTVVFDCEICDPVEGMILTCKVINKHTGGIMAISSTETPSPITVYITNDYLLMFPSTATDTMNELSVGDVFDAKIIGARKKLGMPTIDVIGVFA